jgi:hypothetical protein
MLHQLAVDQLHDLVDVAALDAFVGANGIQSFVGNAFTKASGASSAAKTAGELKKKPKAQTSGPKKVKNLRFIGWDHKERLTL